MLCEKFLPAFWQSVLQTKLGVPKQQTPEWQAVHYVLCACKVTFNFFQGFRDWLIHIHSLTWEIWPTGTLQPQFMSCQPDTSHILLWHTLICYQITSHDQSLDMSNLPCWKQMHLPTFPFLGDLFIQKNPHIFVHYFIDMMGGNLLLFHISPSRRLTHRQCCQSVVKDEETDNLLAWHPMSTEETYHLSRWNLRIQKQKR